MEQSNTLPRNNKTNSNRQQKRPKRITPDYLHNSGLYYLERFAASTAQFRTVMRRKITKSCYFHTDQDESACQDMLEELITKFQRLGLLDDDQYTRAVVNSARNRGLSEKSITAKLRSKGVAKPLIEKYLDDHDMNDMTAALRLCQRKKIGPFDNKTHDDPQKIYDKTLAKLARAGFSYDIAKSALSLGRREAEDKLITAR